MTPTVLCVDDDKSVLSALRTLLQSSLLGDCRIEIAESGQEALEIQEELVEGDRPVQVVVSDFIMPAMRGDELLVRLHERAPGMVKIMLTGQADFSGVKRVINEANLFRFIEKPFNHADLVLSIRAALQARSRELELQARIEKLEREVDALRG